MPHITFPNRLVSKDELFVFVSITKRDSSEFITKLDIKEWQWIKDYTLYINNYGYVLIIDAEGKAWLLHRLLLDNPINKVVDHIDRDILNNSLVNLRACTVAENMQNLKLATGVTKCSQTNKFKARVGLNGKMHFLGLFDSHEEATNKVLEFKAKFWPYSKESLKLDNSFNFDINHGDRRRVSRVSLTINEVEVEYTEAGFTLLDKEYKGTNIPLACICSCGNHTVIALKKLRLGQKCKACGYIKVSNAKSNYHSQNRRVECH